MNDPLLTPQRYTRIRELFLQVCELDPLERSAILDSACADDGDLRGEVESLLREDSHASGIVGEHQQRRNTVSALARSASIAALESLPCQFGRYRLLRVIGEGGMGTVYEAQQLHPHRMVALKLLRPGLTTTAMLRRFDYEAHVLGLLQHSGIAQIFEAGTADRGQGEQPFFAMELIHGQPLLKYAAAHTLSARQKLELMARICDAVQHSHTKGVVHRDLKPNNILIDESGQPKILDFGVARATDCDIQTTTLHTQVGQLVGTLAYMSPEQAGGNPDDVDTRSDVYSLGVIGYELLSGRLPLELERKPLHEAVRLIREQDPPRLGALNRAFRGDIETIIAKAMEKEPGRRYPSAAELAADLHRHLSHEPIAAQPSSTLYILHRFASRHRVLVSIIVSAFLLLLAAVVTVSLSLRHALLARDAEQQAQQLAHQRLEQMREAHNAASHHARQAEAVNQFLQEILVAGDPDIDQGSRLTVREVLDRSAASIDQSFDKQANVKSALLSILGQSYHHLGAFDVAERCLRQALELRMTSGVDNEHLLQSHNELIDLFFSTEKWDEAERLIAAGIDLAQKKLDPDHPDALEIRANQAALAAHRGRDEVAIELYQPVLERRLRVLGSGHEDTITTQANIASCKSNLGRFAEAAELHRQAADAARVSLGENHRLSLSAIQNEAVALLELGNAEEARQLLETVLEARRRTLGETHASTLKTVTNLAKAIEVLGEYDQAERLLLTNLDQEIAVLGELHSATQVTMNQLAGLYLGRQRWKDAELMLRRALELRERSSGPAHPKTLIVKNNLANSLRQQNRFDEAAVLYEELLATARHNLPAEHWYLAAFEVSYGTSLARAGRYEDAELLLLGALTKLEETMGPRQSQTINAMLALTELYKRWNKPEQQAKYKSLLHERRAKP